MVHLVVATKNKGKMKEFRSILSALPVTLLSMEEAGITLDVDETGSTFEENALLKAEAIYQALVSRQTTALPAAPVTFLVLADDSGLEVDALGGAPGIYSARYGGPGLTDTERWQLLLKQLEGVDAARRTGRFVCAAAVVAGNRRLVARGTIEGTILTEARGNNGFGYDPVFFSTEAGMSTAELEDDEKNRISHRGRALEKVLQALSGPEWADLL